VKVVSDEECNSVLFQVLLSVMKDHKNTKYWCISTRKLVWYKKEGAKATCAKSNTKVGKCVVQLLMFKKRYILCREF
jgi:hypothetical protein